MKRFFRWLGCLFGKHPKLIELGNGWAFSSPIGNVELKYCRDCKRIVGFETKDKYK